MFATRLRRTILATLACGALVAPLAACGSSDSDDVTTSDGKKLTTVTFALDYVGNNAGFAGAYAAQSLGYFKAAGLNVKIEPYSDTSADVLVGAGKADFGTIDQPDLMIDDAAGQGLTSIMIIMQHEAERLAIAHKDTSKVGTPKDLDSLTFGGYGTPLETALNDVMIKAAGGDADYKKVTLGPSVYTSLQSGQVDWAIPYATDDIAWAQMEGTPWKTFDPTDYGVPDFYDKLVFTSSKYAGEHPDLTKKFVAALLKGYQWAAADPAKAVTTQAKLVSGAFDVGQQTKTAQLLASDYWLTDDKAIGPSQADVWTKVGQFLVSQKILKDSDGKVLTSLPNVSGWSTNEYLPAS